MGRGATVGEPERPGRPDRDAAFVRAAAGEGGEDGLPPFRTGGDPPRPEAELYASRGVEEEEDRKKGKDEDGGEGDPPIKGDEEGHPRQEEEGEEDGGERRDAPHCSLVLLLLVG